MLCLSIMAGKWTLARAKPCLIILKLEEKVFSGSGVSWVYQANQFRVSDATFCSSWDVRSNLGPEAYIKNSIIMFKLHNNKQAFRSGSCTFVEFTPHFYTLARDLSISVVCILLMIDVESNNKFFLLINVF